MANPIWPVSNSMPQDILVDASAAYQNNLIEFEPDKGESIERARYLAVPMKFSSARVVLTTVAQLQDIYYFFETTIRFGSIVFDWKHPLLQTARECKIKNLTHKSLGNANGPFEVTFDLEVMP